MGTLQGTDRPIGLYYRWQERIVLLLSVINSKGKTTDEHDLLTGD
jgi:hypothetical protein